MTDIMMPPQRRALGVAVALSLMAASVAVMLALRSHLGLATVALVLVIPAVLGVMVGGLIPGAVSALFGFLAYDLLFIKPYGVLAVGRSEDWVPLVVYVLVVLLVARVVDRLRSAEGRALAGRRDAAQLFELSELLVADRPEADLLEIVVGTVKSAFSLDAVVLLLPSGDGSLDVAATAGRPLSAEEVASIVPAAGTPSTLRDRSPTGTGGAATRVRETIALTVGERHVALLGIVGPPLSRGSRELLGTFANHIALALERSHLRDQALRVRLLEEVDQLRRSLLSAVSHDLRTPLASIKTSASALLDRRLDLTPEDRDDLAALIEGQSDRLGRVVSNLLDMSRVQGGALVLDRGPVTVNELVGAVLAALGSAADRVDASVASNLPLLDADRTLLEEALVNVVENALRFAPAGSAVTIGATASGTAATPAVSIIVSDEGPGIPVAERERVFGLFERGAASGTGGGSGGTGLGLAIARAFVEAHGGAVTADEATAGGARVTIDLPTRSPSG